ncbi:MAG: hypothetical protein AAF555_05990 [Verrucomicrobiota bacterium]
MKLVLLFLATASLASAQVYTPPEPSPASNGNSGPSNTTIINQQPEKEPAKSIFGQEIPSFDPTQDLLSFDGRTWRADNNRLMRARFEKYLNEPPQSGEAATDYHATIQKILHFLSPYYREGDGLRKALALLPTASTYPGDANLCNSLGSAIYGVVLSKRNAGEIDDFLTDLAAERDRVRRNADIHSDPSITEMSEAGTQQGGGRQEARKEIQNSSLVYQGYAQRLIEIEALRGAYQTKGEAALLKAKVEYHVLMAQLFMQRRFQHVLMAARFYRQLFTDGDGKLQLKNGSDVSRFFSEGLGGDPSVSTLDTFANEAIHDVKQGIEAFQYLVQQGEMNSASERLAEAYAVGEFLVPVKTLPREKKRRVLAFVQSSNKLLSALQVKDYTLAEQLVKEMESVASDFDSTQAVAAITGFTAASDMNLLEAKLAFQEGNRETATAKVREAAEIWPRNPKLGTFLETVETTGGNLAQAVNDFDRLRSEGNYRQIKERFPEFAAALSEDSERLAELQKLMESYQEIEGALRMAEAQVQAGDPYGAWETAEKARTKYYDDPFLARQTAELSRQAVNFVDAIETGRELQAEAEQGREGLFGSALAHFFEARKIYPGSDFAAEGIEDIVEQILPTDGAPF